MKRTQSDVRKPPSRESTNTSLKRPSRASKSFSRESTSLSYKSGVKTPGPKTAGNRTPGTRTTTTGPKGKKPAVKPKKPAVAGV